MSQVWSVSANIAAYVSESAKPIQRASRKAEIKQAAEELTVRENGQEAAQGSIPVAATASSLYFSTAERRNPQATLVAALEAYEANDSSEE